MSRSPSRVGVLARISRRSRCSRLAKDSFGYGSGWPGPAQAVRLPYRSSIATGIPVSSCRALAMPGWPSPETATWVSRSWMSMLRCRLVTVCGERLVGGGQFGRGGALPGVQPGVGHGHPGLLGDDLDQEPLLGGRFLAAHEATRWPSRPPTPRSG